MWMIFGTFLTPPPPMWIILLNKGYVPMWIFREPPLVIHMVYGCSLGKILIILNIDLPLFEEFLLVETAT